MRDLRSALSWLILRDRNCADVAELLGRDDDQAAEELAALYYPVAFANGLGQPQGTVDDRLVKLLRESDVGFVNSPALDNHLDRHPADAVPWMTFEGRSSYARQVMDRLAKETPSSIEEVGLPRLLRDRRRTVSLWRRWAYFERRDDGWLEMTPYRSLDLLEQIATNGDERRRGEARLKLRDRVLDAISLSEGMRNPLVRSEYLALRVSRVKNPSLRSYRLFPRDGFQIEVTAAGRISDYLETSPDSIDLITVGDLGSAQLRISLDLLEMLELIKRGYRPNSTDLQGLFVNLMIFRNELLSLPFDRLVVTENDVRLYEIASTVGRDGMIRLSLTQSGVNTAGPTAGVSS